MAKTPPDVTIVVHPDALLADLVCYAQQTKCQRGKNDLYMCGVSDTIDEIIHLVKQHTHARIEKRGQ